MKKLFLTMGILVYALIFGTKEVCAQTVMTLDTAISNAEKELSSKLKQDSKIAILSMSSGSERLSTYVIEELTSAFVNKQKVTVVDRSQLDLIQQEMKFQYSGEVSDASAQAIGKKLGAQYIITGSFESLSDYYRFRIKVIEVETAVITMTYSANVQNDRIVASLMSDSGSQPSVSTSKEVKPKEVKPKVNYVDDFTTGQRWGTWALNFVLPGLGSYVVMKDKTGGTFQLISGLGGLAIFGTSMMLFTSGKLESTPFIVIEATGEIMWFVSQIYNIVRSATYHKPQPKTALLFDPSALNIVFLPASNGKIDKVQLSYTMRF
ncbi:CsgG/HfaB family protein [Treponema sp. R80B11-R83G3]